MEFKINEFITIKLEGSETVIYVVGNLVDTLNNFEEDESIDEATVYMNHDLKFNSSNFNKPEVQFWGLYSNLLIWIEHNYDTRLLRSNLALPLLKELTDVGDKTAKRVFKEEIIKRIERWRPQFVYYLKYEGYLNYVDKNELLLILSTNLEDNTKFIKNYEVIFEILKILSSSGDNEAKNMLREGLAKGIKSENLNLMSFLWRNRYLNYLEENELLSILSTYLRRNAKFLKDYETLFSFLRDFSNSGNVEAHKMFKEVIFKNIKSDASDVIQFIFENDFLESLEIEEIVEFITQEENIESTKKLIQIGLFDFLDPQEFENLLNDSKSNMKRKITLMIKENFEKKKKLRKEETEEAWVRYDGF